MKINHIVNASIVALTSLGGAIASVELLIPQMPALARESLAECRQVLRNEGISESQAARMCSYQQDNNWDDDDEDINIEDRYNRNIYNRNRDNRNINIYNRNRNNRDIYNRNRDNWDDNDRDRYRNNRGRIRYLELRARSGRSSDGSWRYYAPNVSDDAMQRAGCQRLNGDNWRCSQPKIRVYTREQSRQYPRQWNRGVYQR